MGKYSLYGPYFQKGNEKYLTERRSHVSIIRSLLAYSNSTAINIKISECLCARAVSNITVF